ncbi:Hypothetical predicted protein [Drosophila guanche]|uniref:Uncharacterized protein n=1 Tax=Drosophila guanche TaxID=7266 RepID=A0A3B0KWB9_DROGU|nr:Hypothetical predicted protein [Drosophila guanche]
MSHPTVVATINKKDLESADDSEEDELCHPTLNGSDTNELHVSICAVVTAAVISYKEIRTIIWHHRIVVIYLLVMHIASLGLWQCLGPAFWT